MGEFFVTNGQFYKKMGDKVQPIPAQIFHGYWKDPEHFDGLDKDDINTPFSYMGCPEKGKDLVELIKKYCSPTDEIFDIGCNVGRNLDCLYRAGFHNLTGLDINEKAITMGQQFFPDTVGKSKLICSSLEDYLWRDENKRYDVAFTMGVLMHLHPTSDWIYPLFYHTAKKYFITVEDEWNYSNKALPRNYKNIFEDCGFRQVEEKRAVYKNDIDETGDINVMYRIFKNET